MAQFITMDVGGTYTKVTLLKAEQQTFSAQFETPDSNVTPDRWWQALFASFQQTLGNQLEASDFDGFGIALPGSFHYQHHVIAKSPNLPVLDGRNVQNDFHAACPASLQPLSHTFMNDADAAGLGISIHHRQQHCIALTLGTGCGSAIITEGRLWMGSNGLGSEIGHSTLDPFSKRQCNCGNFGCVETYVGEVGLIKTAKELYPKANRP